jgi:hypothetical protein
MLRYTTRNNAFTPKRTFALAGDQLIVETAGHATAVVPLREISQVALAFAPTRPERNRFRCALRTTRNGPLVFFNREYRGVLDFLDASAEYTAFVRALNESLARAQPACRYVAGASQAAYVASIAAMVFALIVLIAVAVLLFSIGLSWLVVLKALLIAFYTPTAIHWLKVNRPRSYTPDAIPSNVLPLAVSAPMASSTVPSA